MTEEALVRGERLRRRDEIEKTIDALCPEDAIILLPALLAALTPKEQQRYARRAAARLRSLGYERTRIRIDGRKAHAWVR